MKITTSHIDRRNFLKTTTAITTGLIGLSGFNSIEGHDLSKEDDLFVIGPIEGYSPHIGTLVSMLKYSR